MARSKKESTSALGVGLCRYLVGYLCNRSNATGRSDLYRTSRVFPQRSRPPLRNAIHFSFSCSPSAPVPFSVVREGGLERASRRTTLLHTHRAPRREKRLCPGGPIFLGAREEFEQSQRRGGGRGQENRCKVDINNHDLGGWEKQIQDVARPVPRERLGEQSHTGARSSGRASEAFILA